MTHDLFMSVDTAIATVFDSLQGIVHSLWHRQNVNQFFLPLCMWWYNLLDSTVTNLADRCTVHVRNTRFSTHSFNEPALAPHTILLLLLPLSKLELSSMTPPGYGWAHACTVCLSSVGTLKASLVRKEMCSELTFRLHHQTDALSSRQAKRSTIPGNGIGSTQKVVWVQHTVCPTPKTCMYNPRFIAATKPMTQMTVSHILQQFPMTRCIFKNVQLCKMCFQSPCRQNTSALAPHMHVHMQLYVPSRQVTAFSPAGRWRCLQKCKKKPFDCLAPAYLTDWDPHSEVHTFPSTSSLRVTQRWATPHPTHTPFLSRNPWPVLGGSRAQKEDINWHTKRDEIL